jgi:uncharacterized protein
MASRAVDTEQLFVDPACDWHGVSPRLLTLRRITPGTLMILSAVGIAALSALEAWFPVALVGAALLGSAWWWWWLPRQVASWRYAERDDDLLVSRGRILRKLSVVPYGRMQVIDVEAGPLEAHFGIASVELVTASASTDAKIPGLPTAVAHNLRDRLAARGEATAAGL